jgi:hypothetical protein
VHELHHALRCQRDSPYLFLSYYNAAKKLAPLISYLFLSLNFLSDLLYTFVFCSFGVLGLDRVACM